MSTEKKTAALKLEPLSSLSMGQKIRVIQHSNESMIGLTGNVVRCRIADDGAWVRMNTRLDSIDFPFKLGDKRSHHTLLYPEQCERIK